MKLNDSFIFMDTVGIMTRLNHKITLAFGKVGGHTTTVLPTTIKL